METARGHSIKVPNIYSFDSLAEIKTFVNSFSKYYDFEGVALTYKGGTVKIKSEKYFSANIDKVSKLNVEYIYDIWMEEELDDIIAHLPPMLAEKVIAIIEKFKHYKEELNMEYERILPQLKKCHDIKDVAVYLQEEYPHKKYFNLFINKFKEKPLFVEKSRKNLILQNFKTN
jgi:hypothetical protein